MVAVWGGGPPAPCSLRQALGSECSQMGRTSHSSQWSRLNFPFPSSKKPPRECEPLSESKVTPSACAVASAGAGAGCRAGGECAASPGHCVQPTRDPHTQGSNQGPREA